MSARRRLPGVQRGLSLPARMDGSSLQRIVSRWPVGAPLQPELLPTLSQQRHLSQPVWGLCLQAGILGSHLSEQMPSGDVWRRLQPVLLLLWPFVPLPPCDRRVQLRSGIHWTGLRQSVSVWLLRRPLLGSVHHLQQQLHLRPSRWTLPVSLRLDGQRLLHPLRSWSLRTVLHFHLFLPFASDL